MIAADLQDGVPMINLATVEGQQAIAEYVDQADVIILDNLASLCRSGDENEREPWLIVQGWLLKLRSQGRAVVLVHHAGKNKDQRGTSAREDVLDTVVKLSRPTDCQGDEGLRVEWQFVKHRGFYGPDAMPIEVSLTSSRGELTWAWQPLETSLVLQVAEHLNETECSLSDIAKDMGLPKTTVWRLKKRAEAMGLLKSKPGGQKRND